ncbi:MAG TPA: FecR domain-containing protein [Gemmatimonadales bacterium]|nr:FecR domain-containing protein [Gemmatimonadales bacterium]
MNERDPEFEPLRRDVAGLPRRIEPPRDLWPGIAARLDQAARERPMRRVWMPLLAAAAGLLLIVVARRGGLRLDVRSLAGDPRITSNAVSTDDSSRARITLTIGTVDLEPGSRLRAIAVGGREQRFALERGAISARVDAPPRVFIVETPSATATDLGCAYTMRVDSAGNGELHVTAGVVELGMAGRRAIVPIGARAALRAGVGPGTPTVDDAPVLLRTALDAFDFGNGGPGALAAALAAARPADGLTLWHLLSRAPASMRGLVFDRLAAIAPPPAGVTRDGVLRLDAKMLDAWWDYVPGTVRRVRAK